MNKNACSVALPVTHLFVAKALHIRPAKELCCKLCLLQARQFQYELLRAHVAEWPHKPVTNPVFLVHCNIRFRFSAQFMTNNGSADEKDNRHYSRAFQKK